MGITTLGSGRRVAIKETGGPHRYKWTKAPRSMSSRGFRFRVARLSSDFSGRRHQCCVPRSPWSCLHNRQCRHASLEYLPALCSVNIPEPPPRPCDLDFRSLRFLTRLAPYGAIGHVYSWLSSTCKGFWKKLKKVLTLQ